jgi:hypothetical protein
MLTAAAMLFGAAWFQARRAEALVMTRTEVERERASTEQKIQQAEERIRNLERNEEALRATVRPVTATTKEPPPQPVAKPQPRPTRLNERLKHEPEMQALWLISRRAELATRYGPLLQHLKLSPDQRARFEALELRREEREFDLKAAEGVNGISAVEPAMVALRKQVTDEYNESMRGLLAETGYEQKKEFERTTWLREMVNGIMGGAVVVAREPLSADQGERLLRVMANASKQYQRGGQASSGDLDWQQIDAEARAFITDAQFAFFKTMEPPLPLGARHQAELYRVVEAAKKRESAGAR